MKNKPRTKAAKRRKAAKVMREYHAGELRSGSGHKVTSPAQAKAIAMSESGQSKKRRKR
ncbi:MAG: hypothetical protein R3212_07295 [Xanthomonadales bacterium]|nr:hypothetical protein [Xanthomonadales bacterium]